MAAGIDLEQVFYICDGEACENPKGCYKQGGECWHTSKIEHAVNFSHEGRTWTERGLIAVDKDGHMERENKSGIYINNF